MDKTVTWRYIHDDLIVHYNVVEQRRQHGIDDEPHQNKVNVSEHNMNWLVVWEMIEMIWLSLIRFQRLAMPLSLPFPPRWLHEAQGSRNLSANGWKTIIAGLFEDKNARLHQSEKIAQWRVAMENYRPSFTNSTSTECEFYSCDRPWPCGWIGRSYGSNGEMRSLPSDGGSNESPVNCTDVFLGLSHLSYTIM